MPVTPQRAPSYWPFRLTIRNGTVIVNKAPKVSRAQGKRGPSGVNLEALERNLL